jgi:primosomal protein N' (replication factor Y)
MAQLSIFKPGESRGGVFVRVAVERGIRDADEPTLLYGCREADIAIGERVEVPLRGSRKPVGGIVVEVGGAELLGELDPGRVKEISLRSGARLPPDLVELASWMATYYLCPLGMVMATMMPAAVKHRTGLRTRVGLIPARLVRGESKEAGETPRLTPSAEQARQALARVPDEAWPIEAKPLAARLGLKSVAPLNALVRAAILVEQRFDVVTSRTGGAPQGEARRPRCARQGPLRR